MDVEPRLVERNDFSWVQTSPDLDGVTSAVRPVWVLVAKVQECVLFVFLLPFQTCLTTLQSHPVTLQNFLGWLYTGLDFLAEKRDEGQPRSGPSVCPDVGAG